MLKKPQRVRLSKRHPLKTVLSGRDDAGGTVDVLLRHRKLPECAEDVGDGDE